MTRLRRRKYRRVLIDVDTQYDQFWHADGNVSELLGRIRRIAAWARKRRVLVISTALARRPPQNSILPNGDPILCIEGTSGQQKISYTLLPRRLTFGPENRLDLPRHLLSDAQQVIFEKRTEDPFSQPRADRLLTEMRADEFIVFGMGTETAVKATVLGLLHRGKRVRVLVDAVDGGKEREVRMALRQMEAKGARLSTSDVLTGHSRLVGKCALRARSPVGDAS